MKKDVEVYYRNKGVEIACDPDLYSTDLFKSLRWLRQVSEEKEGGKKELDVLVMGGLGGRVDQGFSQIHHMYAALNDEKLLVGKMYLLSEQSISFVLEKGSNSIKCAVEIGVNVGEQAIGRKDIFGENVGIIPVSGPAVISTKGLEWDVQDWKTEFGGQISTSNYLRADTIKIETNERVLFTVELATHLCSRD